MGMTDADINFVARQSERIMSEIESLRDDAAVLIVGVTGWLLWPGAGCDQRCAAVVLYLLTAALPAKLPRTSTRWAHISQLLRLMLFTAAAWAVLGSSTAARASSPGSAAGLTPETHSA